MKLWSALKGYRTHIINALFALGAIGGTLWDSVFQVMMDPSVQTALQPVIPAKYAGAYALVWAIVNAAMREATSSPSRLFRKSPKTD